MEQKKVLVLVLVLAFLFILHKTDAPLIRSTECSARVTEGGTAILQVNIGISLDLNDLMVEWKCGGKFVHQFQHGVDYLKTQNQEYKGRTSLFKDEFSRGNVSLKLMNVTVEDAGTYSLTLQGSNIPDDQWEHSISLCVDRKEDDRQAGTPGEEENDNEEKTQPASDRDRIGLRIGVPVLVFLVVLAGSIFLVLRCRRENRNDQNNRDPPNNSVELNDQNNPTTGDEHNNLDNPDDQDSQEDQTNQENRGVQDNQDERRDQDDPENENAGSEHDGKQINEDKNAHEGSSLLKDKNPALSSELPYEDSGVQTHLTHTS